MLAEQHALKPDLGSELRFLPIPPASDALVMGRSRRYIAVPFGMEKLEWWAARWLNFFEDMFIHFDRMYERDRHTDGHTDRRTDTA